MVVDAMLTIHYFIFDYTENPARVVLGMILTTMVVAEKYQHHRLLSRLSIFRKTLVENELILTPFQPLGEGWEGVAIKTEN